MRVVLGAAILILLCGNGAFADSQPPTPSLREEAKKHNTEPKTGQNEPSDLQSRRVLFPDITTAHRKWHTDYPANQTDKKSSYDGWLTAIFTGCLVAVGIVQLLLFWRQLRLMRSSLGEAIAASRAAKDSADATKKSVSALIASERPYLLAEVQGKVFPSATTPGQIECGCRCQIINRGKTPGIITYADCKLIRIGENRYDLREGGYIAAKGALGPGESLTFDQSGYYSNAVAKDELFLYGKVGYEDIFGKTHETEFEFVYVGSIEGFCVSGNKERNRYT